MTVKDTFKHEQGQVVRLREYPMRDRVLKENIELQKNDAVKRTDGLRQFARFPEHELSRLAKKAKAMPRETPSYYADLTSRDGEIRSRAIKRLVNSSDGKEYRVGSTSRKSFRFRNNPLAKD